jgi:hypothetical protein
VIRSDNLVLAKNLHIRLGEFRANRLVGIPDQLLEKIILLRPVNTRFDVFEAVLLNDGAACFVELRSLGHKNSIDVMVEMKPVGRESTHRHPDQAAA